MPVLLLRQVRVNVIDAYDFSLMPFSFVNPPTCLRVLFVFFSMDQKMPPFVKKGGDAKGEVAKQVMISSPQSKIGNF